MPLPALSPSPPLSPTSHPAPLRSRRRCPDPPRPAFLPLSLTSLPLPLRSRRRCPCSACLPPPPPSPPSPSQLSLSPSDQGDGVPARPVSLPLLPPLPLPHSSPSPPQIKETVSLLGLSPSPSSLPSLSPTSLPPLPLPYISPSPSDQGDCAPPLPLPHLSPSSPPLRSRRLCPSPPSPSPVALLSPAQIKETVPLPSLSLTCRPPLPLQIKETVPLLGRSGILGEQKNNVFSGVVTGRGALASRTYCTTRAGLLCEFNEKRLLDKWVQLRVGGATGGMYLGN